MWPFLDRRATWLTSDGMDRDDIKTKSNLFRIDGGERERERERERKKISLEKVSEHLLKPTSNLTSATSDPFMSRKPSLGYLESLRWSPIINSVCGRWVRINWELNLRSNTDQSHISTLEESSCSLFFFFCTSLTCQSAYSCTPPYHETSTQIIRRHSRLSLPSIRYHSLIQPHVSESLGECILIKEIMYGK